MGAKKNKAKKIFAQLTPSDSIDDGLVDDIFTILDSREKSVQQQQQQQQQDPASASAQTAATASEKTSSKSRFKARQVCFSPSRPSRAGVTKAYPKARKVAALAELQTPTDPVADAKLEREAKEEERAINRICNELSLDMHEVRPTSLKSLFPVLHARTKKKRRSHRTATVCSPPSRTSWRSSTSSRRTRRNTSTRAARPPHTCSRTLRTLRRSCHASKGRTAWAPPLRALSAHASTRATVRPSVIRVHGAASQRSSRSAARMQ